MLSDREPRKVPSFQYFSDTAMNMSVLLIDHNLAKILATCLLSSDDNDIRVLVADLLRDESGHANRGKPGTHFCCWVGRLSVLHFAPPFVRKVYDLAIKSGSQNPAIQGLLDKIDRRFSLAKSAA